MNFVPKRENFTSVPVWVRLYSLPLDYWQLESLSTIGNKLGRFVKASEATKKGKYTSFARICVEMDLSGALPDEKGKWNKRGLKPLQIEKQLASQNRFQALEEEEVITKVDQAKGGSPVEEENGDNDVQTQNINKQKEEMMSDTKLEMDQKMT
eukprot:PITA_31199